MGYPSHPLADLVIPVGTKPSNAIALNKFRSALALSIGGPPTLDGTVVVQGKGVDDTWRAVQKDEDDVNITVGDETLVERPGRFKALRLLSSSDETPARTCPVQAIYEVI